MYLFRSSGFRHSCIRGRDIVCHECTNFFMGVLASDGTPTSFEIKPVLRVHFPANDRVSVLYRTLPDKVETRKARRADIIIERIFHVSKNPEGVILLSNPSQWPSLCDFQDSAGLRRDEKRKARRADMIIERIFNVSKNPEGVILLSNQNCRSLSRDKKNNLR